MAVEDVAVKPPRERRYLGDGVYADFDGFQIVLTVPPESSNDSRAHTIYLEPGTLNELDRYRKDCYGR